jgi:hypothetical protein
MYRASALVLLLTACAGGSYAAGPPTPAIAMRPEDRVLLGDFSRVTAIAASYDRVYVAYASAIGVYRPLARRWDVPRSPRSPGLLQSVIAGIVDPVDQSLWLATTTGWVHYQPDIDRWDTGEIATRVTGLASDPVNPGQGIWFRTGSGWLLQPRVGPPVGGAPPAGLKMPPTINDAYADIPQLRSLAPRVLTGPLMAQGSFTAAAPNSQGSGWFLGTSNRGLLFFDRTAIEAQPIALGLPGDVVGAIASTVDGIWVVTDRSLRLPAAITFLSEDLGTSTGIPGSAAFGLPFDAARQLTLGERAVWLATEKGLVRASIDDGRITRWDTPQGLPDSRVTVVAQARGRIVAGTMRGLVSVGADDQVTRRAPSFDGAIYALKANGDTLWVGTAFGLFASLAGDDSLRMPEGFRQLGAIPAVLGVGYVADTLVVMTPDHLVWRNPLSGAWTRGPDLAGPLGQLTAFAATPDGVWVGGTRGAGLVRPTTSVLRPLLVGGDLPAEVTSIVVSGNYLWIGTVAGLVRIRLVDR